jgi:hypothetical protein
VIELVPVVRGLGWIPDPEKLPGQAPDWDAAEVLGADPVPERADNRDLSMLLDQGPAPSCVAHAVLQIVRMDHVRQGHLDAPLGSRLWAWLFSRAMHDAVAIWGGTYIRAMCEALNRQGLPAEQFWPYLFDEVDGVERWRAMPSGKAHQMAHDQKQVLVYRRIREAGYDRVDAVKRALARRKGVAWGTQVTREFVRGRFSDNHVADPPVPGDDVAGGHAMALDFFEGDEFEGWQSYGPEYWLDGRYRVSADYLASSLSRDFWIVEQAPIFSELEVPR